MLLIAFCRTLIDWSNAAFNHQSMSFKDNTETLFSITEPELILQHWSMQLDSLLPSALSDLSATTQVIHTDARHIPAPDEPYTCVITSPPYPNRMSYIRELRPYMYWLGYLTDAREAGELDWQAIGGTWGIATSRLNTWQIAPAFSHIEAFRPMLQQIAVNSQPLANYVHRYFEDIFLHLTSLYHCLADEATLHYIVGNSVFYQTPVPVERIYAELMRQVGYHAIDIRPVRK